MKVLANDGLDREGCALLQEAGFKVRTTKINQAELAGHINGEGIEILLVRSATQVRKDLIDNCPGLKLIGRAGVGMDNIDVEYARSRGIKVINTPGASSQSVAELVFAHLFSLCRSLHESNRLMPAKGDSEFEVLTKKFSSGVELRGKTMGIIGFGRIGQAVAKYAIGLGMKVMAHDSSAYTKEIYIELGGSTTAKITLTTISLEELLKNSDFITIHVPAQKNKACLIGREEIEKMKKGVYLINTSRGGIIDEKALLEGIDAKKISGAALDVFVGEPKPDPALLRHPAISLSPHIGAATAEAQLRIASEMASQIIETFQPA